MVMEKMGPSPVAAVHSKTSLKSCSSIPKAALPEPFQRPSVLLPSQTSTKRQAPACLPPAPAPAPPFPQRSSGVPRSKKMWPTVPALYCPQVFLPDFYPVSTAHSDVTRGFRGVPPVPTERVFQPEGGARRGRTSLLTRHLRSL